MGWAQECEQVKKQNIVWFVIMTDFPHACYFYLLSFVTMIKQVNIVRFSQMAPAPFYLNLF